MTQWHPQPEQLVEYAAGSSHTGLSVAISVHLHFCKHCRERISELESANAVLFESQEPVSIPGGAFDQLMQRINEEPQTTPVPDAEPKNDRRYPRALQSLLPESIDDLNWRHPMKNLSVTHLMTDESGMIIGLHHMKAGGRVPNHSHRGDEINVVLEGGFSDEMGSYAEGDFVFRSDSDTHAPQADAHGDCLMLSVVAAPVKLTGPLGWLINPFIKA